MHSNLIKKLDLEHFISSYKEHLARDEELFLIGDLNLHFDRINELSSFDLKAAGRLINLEKSLNHLSKQGVLHLDELFYFVKIIRYIRYLKRQDFVVLKDYLDKIIIPDWAQDFADIFDENGELKIDLDERLTKISSSIKAKKEQIKEQFKRILSSSSLDYYLIDKELHLIQDKECLLLRGGFANVIKGLVLSRSSAGGFYVLPQSIRVLESDLENIKEKQEELYYEYAKKYSKICHENLLFLKFIDKTFSLLNSYQARARYAKEKDLVFIKPNKSGKINLIEFKHPAIKEAKPVSVSFNKKVLLITGVNAGGKSMLLKSILSASFLAKNLLPMRINSKSEISTFKHYEAIIEDPQSAANNISTFAGRMKAISKIFGKEELLLGIDEIELGTDFEEASSLFFTIISSLIKKDVKLIITTHHKRLALLLAKDEQVELCAALYDEINSKPLYEFLPKQIGKSYAFETALRYGIPPSLIEGAKALYSEERANLEAMINSNLELELELRLKQKEIDIKEQRIEKKLIHLEAQKEELELEQSAKLSQLEQQYQEAINLAKEAAKNKDAKDAARALNKASKSHKSIEKPLKLSTPEELAVGDAVRYQSTKGRILSLNKSEAFIDCDFGKMKVPISSLKKIHSLPKKNTAKKATLKLSAAPSGAMKLDLHGMRADEAMDALDTFLSDALVAGFEEVLIFHGMGTGRLAYLVKEALKEHPRVVKFADAPPNMGGSGAKLAWF